jgi:hypothetical protein
LIFDFDPGYLNINNFEATLLAPGGYYAVWPSLYSISACGMLTKLSEVRGEHGNQKTEQHWIYVPTNEDIIRGADLYYHSLVVPFPQCP